MNTPPDPAALVAATPDQQPAATPEQAALLEWAEAHPTNRPTIPKDGNGRYKAVPPAGGKPKGHTRVTTFAGALDDTEGLTVWRNRLLAEGVANNPDIIAGINNANGDKRRIGSLAADALHQAGEKLAADVGTAIHTAIEHGIDRTPGVPAPPAPYDADVTAALTELKAHMLRPVHLEAVMLCPYDTIGTGDMLAAGPWGDKLRWVDHKTGSNPVRLSYAIQLWMYGNATHMWNGDGWDTAPVIDTDTAYILHVPAGTGTATLVEVNIGAAAPLAELANMVRTARSKKTTEAMFTRLEATEVPEVPDAPVPEQTPPDNDTLTPRTEWLVNRIRTTPRDQRGTLARRWPDNVPTSPPWTHTHIDTLDPIIAIFEPTFATPDPTRPDPVTAHIDTLPSTPTPAPAPVDDGTPPNQADETAVRNRFAALEPAQADTVARWIGEAKRASTPFAVGPDSRTHRTVTIGAAATACAAAFHDDTWPDHLTNLVITHTVGSTHTGTTGAKLGALTANQAADIQQLADAFHQSAPDALTLCGELVQASPPGDATTQTKETP